MGSKTKSLRILVRFLFFAWTSSPAPEASSTTSTSTTHINIDDFQSDFRSLTSSIFSAIVGVPYVTELLPSANFWRLHSDVFESLPSVILYDFVWFLRCQTTAVGCLWHLRWSSVIAKPSVRIFLHCWLLGFFLPGANTRQRYISVDFAAFVRGSYCQNFIF